MYCPNCGKFNEDASVFCSGCGKPLGGSVPQANGYTNPYPTAAPAGYPSNTPNSYPAADPSGYPVQTPPKKKPNWLLIALIAAALVVVVLVVLPMLAKDTDITMEEIYDLGKDREITLAEARSLLGEPVTPGDTQNGWVDPEQTFHGIPIESALHYNEDRVCFVFYFADSDGSAVRRVIEEECVYEDNLLDMFYKYSYRGAEITVNPDYTYLVIEFSGN